MAGRVIVDYSYVALDNRSGHRGWRWPALVAACLAVLLVLGLTGGRAMWHALGQRPTASSHALTSAQLKALKPIANPAAISTRPSPSTTAAVSPDPLPADGILTVPYTVQAPNGNWKVFENACEEAALLMYHGYLEGDRRTDIPPTEADPALRAMEQWQVTNWGADRDLTLDKTGQFARAYYGYKYQVMTANQENIVAQVAAGHPVIVPVMTHSLQNHHYGATTVYHEVLIKGYRPDGVITNDAGVQEGKDWFYSWSVLFGAVDAQTPKMGQGRVALVLTK